MKRIKLTAAYDGTNYHGSQIQNNGETIEGVLKKELSSLLQEEIKNNPLCDGDFRSTKGIVDGNNSFDDRTYIRFIV